MNLNNAQVQKYIKAMQRLGITEKDALESVRKEKTFVHARELKRTTKKVYEQN